MLGVHRLARHPERVADLLPGPASAAGGGDLGGLDALREAVQREDGSQAEGRVIRGDGGGDPIDVHAVSLD
jgi:hypothetical protein